MKTTQRFDSPDVDTTEAIGAAIGAAIRRDGVLLLDGDLGVGKTVLVRGVARGLGLDAAAVQSPTFTIVHEHRPPGADPGKGAPNLVHIDLYRLAPEETESIGLDEMLAGPGVKAIEWPERLIAPPPQSIRVRLEQGDGGARTVTITDGPAIGDTSLGDAVHG